MTAQFRSRPLDRPWSAVGETSQPFRRAVVRFVLVTVVQEQPPTLSHHRHLQSSLLTIRW